MSETHARTSGETVKVPANLNAESLVALRLRLTELASSDPSLVVLRGEDTETFCLGLDLQASGRDEAVLAGVFDTYAELLSVLRAFPRPTIAVVSGRCLGGGLGIAACADFVFATPQASFGLPELWLGLVPGICSVVLEDRLTRQQIRTLALTASAVDADRARAMGLVDVLHADEASLERAVTRFARRSAEYTTASVQRFKRFLLETKTCDTRESFERSREMMHELTRLPETRALLSRRLEQLK